MHFRASSPLRAAALAALVLNLHACAGDDASDASTTGDSGTSAGTSGTSAASDPTASTSGSASTTASTDPTAATTTAATGETSTTGDTTGATTGPTTGPGVLPGETGLDAFCRRYVECGGSYYNDQQDCIDASLNYWGACPSRREALDDFGACMSEMECSDWNPDAYNPGSTPCAELWTKLGDSQPCE